jgi:IMP cyclohydrolase
LLAVPTSTTPTVRELLASRPYPGRGLLLGAVAGRRLVVYFVTGRSIASRSRRLVARPSGDLDVTDTQLEGKIDPLRHYRAATRRNGWQVIGNGDHVEGVAAELAIGTDPLTIMTGLTVEPDPPISTPRIWLALRCEGVDAAAIFGYLRRRADEGIDRVVWSVSGLASGHAVLLSTYEGTETDVRPVQAPVEVSVAASDGPGLLSELWSGLNPDLRVGAALLTPDDADAGPILIP